MTESYLLAPDMESASSRVRTFLRSLLEQGGMDGILVPMGTGEPGPVMPTLVRDPEQMERCEPFSPAFPLNSARLLSRMTRKGSSGKIAAFLRPCEIRAFVELIKLNQGSLENLLLISFDCPGAWSNRTFARMTQEGVVNGDALVAARFAKNTPEPEDENLASACRMCESPFPVSVDVEIRLAETRGKILAASASPQGIEILSKLSPGPEEADPDREKNITRAIRELTQKRDLILEETIKATSTLKDLSHYLSACINCTNCRVACPVCYCKECVFNTDVFDYDSHQYMFWAEKKGALRLPGDTLFFHLTRMAHIGLSCVGCGQCSNACPNDIPVAELFRSTALAAQKGFNYLPGADPDERLPLSYFEEDELGDTVGIS